MGLQYATIGFFEALADALNEDEAFRQRASSLKTELLFVTDERPDGALLRIEGGKVKAQQVPKDSKAEFTFLASYPVWISNHRDGQPLEKLIMTGKVKFKGSIPKIMMLKSTLNIVDQKSKGIPAEY